MVAIETIVVAVVIIIVTSCLALTLWRGMGTKDYKPRRDVDYEIELKKGWIFQLRKPKACDGTQITNKETLVIMYGFVGATEKLIAKYCDIYLTRGLNVLYIPCQVQHFANADAALKLGRDLLEFLDTEANEHKYYIVHAFSGGNISFNICVQGLIMEQTEKYGYVKDKIKAIVSDSCVLGPPEHRTACMSRGISRNKLWQVLIKMTLDMYFFFMYDSVKRFNHWQEMCKTFPIEVPTLYFLSENDPMSDHEYIHEMIEGFKEMGTFPVIEKCWKKSGHVAHLKLHTDEYLDCITELFGLVPELKELRHNPVRSKM